MHQAVDHSLMGTVVRVTAQTKRGRSDRRAAEVALAEIRRLQGVLNRFDETTAMAEFRRSGAVAAAELADLIRTATPWHKRTGGIFDPTGSSGPLPWELTETGIRVTGNTATVDFNAIAKGWIVDRAAQAVDGRVRSLVIDAGGDVLHRGDQPLMVGIEDPHRPYDNVAPLTQVSIQNEAIATSGPSRRGEHIRDPRTGKTADGTAGASVIAPDAATADVIATSIAIVGADGGIELADELHVAALVVAADGTVMTNRLWDQRIS